VLQDRLAQFRGSEPTDAARRIDLDWVRIAAFGLLILYHVGMLYVSRGFHIKSDYRIPALEPLTLVLNPWRLALLFLVSGAATRFMLRKLPPRHLLRSRKVRLLPPLVFGMLIVVPPQAYVQVVEALGYDGGVINFYLEHYFAFGKKFCHPGPCLILPTWNHLWFVAYLWVYTVVLGPAWSGASSRQ
jgi:Acyltransferase family